MEMTIILFPAIYTYIYAENILEFSSFNICRKVKNPVVWSWWSVMPLSISAKSPQSAFKDSLKTCFFCLFFCFFVLLQLCVPWNLNIFIPVSMPLSLRALLQAFGRFRPWSAMGSWGQCRPVLPAGGRRGETKLPLGARINRAFTRE